MHRIEPCAPYLPRRASDTNKYDYGRVLIVGGCVGYTGAPTLCAHAALRCGAGLVSVGVPEAIYAITAVKNDAAMPFPLPSADGKLTADALPELLERLRRSDVCVLGPGLGRNAALTALVQAVVLRSETALVLDADALFAVAQDVAVTTPRFLDLNVRIAYDVPLYREVTMQLYGGVQNLFNAYQQDFDRGAERDSGYVYGPSLPRSWFVGVKLSF